jgi:hypothetical protein
MASAGWPIMPSTASFAAPIRTSMDAFHADDVRGRRAKVHLGM